MISRFTKSLLKATKSASKSVLATSKITRKFSSEGRTIDADVENQVMEVTRNFLEGVKNAEISNLDKNSSFEDLGLDSLDAIDLIVELEESFGIDITNEDAENKIKSLEDACVVFTEYKNNQGESSE